MRDYHPPLDVLRALELFGACGSGGFSCTALAPLLDRTTEEG